MGILGHLVDTTIHKGWVTAYSLQFAVRLLIRAAYHDLSKYLPDEAKGFAQLVRTRKTANYGSSEYMKALDNECIATHYQRNRHHPQHHCTLAEMTLLDVVEMWCDWKASVRTSKTGDLPRSIRINRNRFGECSLWDTLKSTGKRK